MAWEDMSLMEQLSEVSGDVKRCVDAKENYVNQKSAKEYSYFYYNKAFNLVLKLTLGDKEYRRREFIDEIFELREYIEGHSDADADYIMRYWRQFEHALY